MILHPMFKWFGSKWSASRSGHYPVPVGDIHEPFAGGAGYSLVHYERNVVLWDTDKHLQVLWPWLLQAKESDIREIPIGVPVGTDIRHLGLSAGQATLLKSWQRTNSIGDCWTISSWGHLPGQWTENTRSRVAEEVQAIKHWRFQKPIDDWHGTRFVDPPYQYNYQYNSPPIDYSHLASRIIHEWSSSGLVIVVEAKGENGDVPTWLPFQNSHMQVTSRRKSGNHRHSAELVWISASDV